jgi:hypothetical protein
MNKGIQSSVLIGIVVILVVTAAIAFTQIPNQQMASQNTITFRVTVPENTPEGDTVYIYLALPEGVKKFQMQKVGQFVYERSFSHNELGSQDEVRYRYSRNGYDFHTAEYLEPDTNDYFWTQLGRKITFQPGKVQEDGIVRWRFFPERNVPIVRTTTLEPQGNFLSRINDIEFRSGQTIEDLYVAAFHDFFNSTARHMKQMGYTWVEFDPPWQWIEVNGLPKVSNEFQNNPNYPDDGTFLEEIRAHKREGLKVMIGPQLCCNALDTKNRSAEWWQAYFSETEKFLVHFARLAQQADANAFFYAVPSFDLGQVPVDMEKEWRRIFSSIRSVFKGEVGQMVWVLGPEVSANPKPIPDADFVKWGDALDFFLVATEFPLSTKDNPTDEELRDGALAVLDGVNVFYDKFQKPIIVRNGYFNVKYSWKGQSFYSISSIPWISDPEAALEKSVYTFDTLDHARTINAYFQAIASRPWVVGYFHFGYTHWEDPLSPWMSVRGKPVEDLWMKWNRTIYG